MEQVKKTPNDEEDQRSVNSEFTGLDPGTEPVGKYLHDWDFGHRVSSGSSKNRHGSVFQGTHHPQEDKRGLGVLCTDQPKREKIQLVLEFHLVDVAGKEAWEIPTRYTLLLIKHLYLFSRTM